MTDQFTIRCGCGAEVYGDRFLCPDCEDYLDSNPYALCDESGFPLDLSAADFDDELIADDLAYPAQYDDPNEYRSVWFILSDPTRDLTEDPFSPDYDEL